MKTVTGVFGDSNLALEAGERVREVAGSRSTVRILMPGRSRTVIETAVLEDTSSWSRVALISAALGAVGVVVFHLLGASWAMAMLGLLWGVGAGLMLGAWLTGEV